MKNYRADFFLLEKEENDNGDLEVTGEKHLGHITLDDNGVGQDFTLTAKAFRHAPSLCLMANKVIVYETHS